LSVVLDAYLANALLSMVLVILLLTRPVRAYFGITRPAAAEKAA
jgi:hypothetical protein